MATELLLVLLLLPPPTGCNSLLSHENNFTKSTNLFICVLNIAIASAFEAAESKRFFKLSIILETKKKKLKIS